ncbi:hypothetical protein HY024_00440 [Candidatus Curtissbacteria bacterium]|nr:hypothetical protein [Candidatus Curtissbacteria bacterium]
MERYIGSVPHDYLNSEKYPEYPEFYLKPEGESLVEVEQAQVEVGSIDSTLVSSQFLTCTAFLFASQDMQTFALLHAWPNARLYSGQAHQLKDLNGGRIIGVRGTDNLMNPLILEDFAGWLAIHDVSFADINTHSDNPPVDPVFGPYNPNFAVSFRPKENMFYVARAAHGDIQRFRAF